MDEEDYIDISKPNNIVEEKLSELLSKLEQLDITVKELQHEISLLKQINNNEIFDKPTIKLYKIHNKNTIKFVYYENRYNIWFNGNKTIFNNLYHYHNYEESNIDTIVFAKEINSTNSGDKYDSIPNIKKIFTESKKDITIILEINEKIIIDLLFQEKCYEKLIINTDLNEETLDALKTHCDKNGIKIK
jgi:hypothetical protein